MLTRRSPRPLNLRHELFSHTENIADHIPDLPTILVGNKREKIALDKNIQKIVKKYGNDYQVLLEHTDAGVDIKFYTLKTFPNPRYLPRDTILILLDLGEFLTQWKLISKEGLDITHAWNPTMGIHEGRWIPK